MIGAISIVGILLAALGSLFWLYLKSEISHINTNMKKDNQAVKDTLISSHNNLSDKIDTTSDYNKDTRKSAYHAHDRITEVEKNINERLSQHVKDLHIK